VTINTPGCRSPCPVSELISVVIYRGGRKYDSFIPFPVIETKHLILRRMELRDTDDVFEMRSNSGMHRYTDTKPDETPQETRAYIEKMRKGVDENQWIIWVIEHQQSKKVRNTLKIETVNCCIDSVQYAKGKSYTESIPLTGNESWQGDYQD
jgi:hypothetical protein